MGDPSAGGESAQVQHCGPVYWKMLQLIALGLQILLLGKLLVGLVSVAKRHIIGCQYNRVPI